MEGRGRSSWARFTDVFILGVVLSLMLLGSRSAEPAVGGVEEPTASCNPEPVRCETGGLECWVINVKFFSDHSWGGTVDNRSYDGWFSGPTWGGFANRADAECSAERIAAKGVWLQIGSWSPAQIPQNEGAPAYLVPPGAITAVTLLDFYAGPPPATLDPARVLRGIQPKR